MKKYFYITIPLLLLAVFVFFSSSLWKREAGRDLSPAQAAASRIGLVGHWTMDVNDMSTTGATLYDKSGQNNHGTVTGTTTSTGKIGQARSFNGTSDSLQVPHSASWNSTDMSAGMWVRFVANGDSMFLQHLSGGGGGGFEFDYQSATSNLIFSPNGAAIGVSKTWAPIVNKWYHIAFTRNATTDANTLYIDGVSLGSTTQTTDIATVTGVLYIGDGTYAGYEINGSLDDVRIYNRALSATEVAQLYSSAKTSYAQSPQRASSTPVSGGKLVGWWTMDANDMSTTGATLYDKSGLGNNGTVTGTTTSTGRINQARSFNGLTNTINIGDKAIYSFTETTPFTISAWFKTATGQLIEIIEKKSTNDLYRLMMQTDGSLYFELNDGTNQLVVNPTASLVNGIWHQAILTYDGANLLTAYVDGVNIGTDNSPALSGVVTAGGNLNIGSGANGNFNGSIDDVRIYNYALSAQEVSNLYNASKQSYVGATVRRTGLVLDLNFGNNDGQAAPKVYDTSGFARHATSTAGATSPTCNAKFCDFDGGDNMTGDATNIFNQTNLSIAIKFSPDFAASEGVNRYILATQAGGVESYSIAHVLDGSIRPSLGGTLIDVIPLASYQSYWKVGQENIIVLTATDGTDRTDIWLNGNKILNNDTSAWSNSNQTAYYIGSSIAKANNFDGKFHYLKVWNRLLTDAEVGILSADRAGYVR